MHINLCISLFVSQLVLLAVEGVQGKVGGMGRRRVVMYSIMGDNRWRSAGQVLECTNTQKLHTNIIFSIKFVKWVSGQHLRSSNYFLLLRRSLRLMARVYSIYTYMYMPCI